MMRFSPVLLEVPARDYNFGYPLKIRFITKTNLSKLTCFKRRFFSVAGFYSFFGELDETTFRRLKDSRTDQVIIRNFLVNFLLLNDEI